MVVWVCDATLAASGGIFLDGDDWDEWEGEAGRGHAQNPRHSDIFDLTANGTFVSQVVVSGTRRRRTVDCGRSCSAPTARSTLPHRKAAARTSILKVVPSRPPAFAAEKDTRDVAENNSTSAVVATVTVDRPGRRATHLHARWAGRASSSAIASTVRRRAAGQGPVRPRGAGFVRRRRDRHRSLRPE